MDNSKIKKPVLKKLSWGEVRKIERFQRRLQRVQFRYQKAVESDDGDDVIDDLEGQIDNLYDEFQGLIAPAIVAIPADWVADDAPDSIKWSDPEQLRWIAGDKVQDLVKLLTGGTDEAADSAKN